MAPLEIKKYPDKVLRKECEPVKGITEKERRIFDEMLFTMRHFCGIGLAAPQLGISKRLIVADVEGNIIKLANPEVIDKNGSDAMREGCLSIPDITVNIRRPDRVVVKGLDERGKATEIKVDGLLARVLQHEIDHLKGRIIIDYMTVLEKLKFKLNKRRR